MVRRPSHFLTDDTLGQVAVADLALEIFEGLGRSVRDILLELLRIGDLALQLKFGDVLRTSDSTLMLDFLALLDKQELIDALAKSILLALSQCLLQLGTVGTAFLEFFLICRRVRSISERVMMSPFTFAMISSTTPMSAADTVATDRDAEGQGTPKRYTTSYATIVATTEVGGEETYATGPAVSTRPSPTCCRHIA